MAFDERGLTSKRINTIKARSAPRVQSTTQRVQPRPRRAQATPTPAPRSSYQSDADRTTQNTNRSTPVYAPAPAPSGGGAWGAGPDNFVDYSIPAGPIAAPMEVEPPPPVVVTPPDPKADPEYQAQMKELAKALADYQNQQNVAQGQYDIGYNDNMRQLGWNPTAGALDAKNMEGFYGQALDNTTNDFASRGMATSGLYGEALGDVTTDYNNRADQYRTARTGFRQGKKAELDSYLSQNESAEAAALRNAVARLSSQYQGV